MTGSIAIVGASARAAAYSALRAGVRPLAADLFADRDLAEIAPVVQVDRYPAALIPWLASTPEETPWIYTGALENDPDLVDELAQIRPLWGCRGPVLRRLRDPFLLKKILADSRVRFPEVCRWTAAESDGLRGRWLGKPYHGSSGAGIQEVETLPAAPPCSPECRPRPAYLQRRIDGQAGAAIFVSDPPCLRCLGVTRQFVGWSATNAKPFQYAGSVGPWTLPSRAEQAIRRAGLAIAQQGLKGAFGIDFVVDEDDQPWVVEVNPRYTASVEIVERMNCVSIFDSPAAPERFIEGPPFYGKAILFARRDIRIAREFSRWVAGSRRGEGEWPSVADIPSEGTLIPAERPVCTVFAEASSPARTEAALAERLSELTSLLHGKAR